MTAASQSFVPPGFSLPMKAAYVLLRSSHLLTTAAALPLAIHFVKSDSTAVALTGPLLWMGIAGIFLAAMLFIVLEQFSYPLTLRWAALATGSFVFNAWSGASLGSFSVAYGGYSIIMSALAAQVIFMTLAAVASFIPTLKRAYLDGLPRWYSYFLLGVAAALALLLFALHRPMVLEIQSEGLLWKRAIYLAAFSVDVVFDMKTLKEGSALNGGAHQKGERTWNIYEAWVTPMVIMLIVSIMVSLFLLF